LIDHTNGFIERLRPAGVSLPRSVDLHVQDDELQEMPCDMRRRRVLQTPALLGCSRQVRAEVIKVAYVQPEYCFESIFHFHEFISRMRNESLESLRKVRVAMPIVDLLILFSLARKCLPIEETEAVYDLFKMRFPPPREGLRRQQLRKYLDEAYKDNDQIFSRANMMRFTHLTVDPLWDILDLNTNHSRMERISSRADEMSGFAIIGEHDIRVSRLLLVKLINFTIDVWKNMDIDPPKLEIVWPRSIGEVELAELQVMNREYKKAEIDT
jgi:hypothetical protein